MHILYCMKSPCIREYEAHIHDCWEIIYQLDNAAVTQVEKKNYTLYPNEIMLIPPGISHKGTSDGFFREIAMRMEGIEFQDFKITKDYRGDILTILSMICRICTEQEGNYAPVADSLAQVVCEMIKHEVGVSSGVPVIEHVKKEMYDNLSNMQFDLTKSIENTGFDKDYFRRCFQKETGKTPKQYLTALRIEHAKRLLRDTNNYSISAIAHNCGFSDSLYFSTCFKKHIGVSPLVYRKKEKIR